MARVSPPNSLGYRQKRSQYAKTQFDNFSQYRRNEFNSLPFLSYEIQQASAGKALAVFLGYFYATHLFQFDGSRSVLI